MTIPKLAEEPQIATESFYHNDFVGEIITTKLPWNPVFTKTEYNVDTYLSCLAGVLATL